MDWLGTQDSMQASNVFADDLFQDPPVLNGYGNHVGSSGDSSPMSDFQPWSPGYMDFSSYGQAPSWSAFGLGTDVGSTLSGMDGSTENLDQRPRSNSAFASYNDYLAAYDESDLASSSHLPSNTSLDGLNDLHQYNPVKSGKSLYQEALNKWGNASQQGIYDPFGVNRQEKSSVAAKPSYSEVAKNRPTPGAPGSRKVRKNLPTPPPDFTPINPFPKKTRGPRMFQPRPRPNSISQCPPVVKPNSKYGLDEFDLPSESKEKFKRSVSADALSHSRCGSSSSVASSTNSGVEEVHKPCNIYNTTPPNGGSKYKVKIDDGSAGCKEELPKYTSESCAEKMFFDPRRMFSNSKKSSNSVPPTKPKADNTTTILNNDKARSQPTSSNSSFHKATYINNNLHEGMEVRKKTNTEAKQENHDQCPEPRVDKENDLQTPSNSASTKVHFLVSGLSIGYEWTKWIVKQAAVWLLVLLVLVLKLVWLILLTSVYYSLLGLQKVWFFIKKKVLRLEGSSDQDSGKFDWSNFPRQSRSEGLDEHIPLPATGAEAMKRLLSYRGKDPYSILGLRHDATDEDIKRYYKKQAFLVHPDKNPEPGSEEAFKILGHAFDLIGDPAKRKAYDTQQYQEGAAQDQMREFADLLQKFQEKMEEAANQMRCDTCGGKHRRTRTDLPWYSARRCDRCQTRHSAKEGDIWAETSMLGFRWHYFACMDNEVFDITELAACQVENFRHVQANTHSVSLRIQTNSGRRHHAAGRSSEADLEDFINNLFHKTMDPNTSKSPQQGSHPAHSSHANTKKKRKNKKRH